jgi:hypothetical protein
VTGFMHASDITVGPPDYLVRPDGRNAPRSTPMEWARRRRVERETRRVAAARNKTKGRLNRLGAAWQLVDVAAMGLPVQDAFVAIGPGGLFAVTVKSQGRSRVLLSGDTVQINGWRPAYVADARALAATISTAFTRMAGTDVPVTPVLTFAGTGLITVYGLPRNCVVMPYRELDNLLNTYGNRIGSRTVDKLASIARLTIRSTLRGVQVAIVRPTG